jgi:hypothetical protein
MTRSSRPISWSASLSEGEVLPSRIQSNRPCLSSEAIAASMAGTADNHELAWTLTHLFLCDRCFQRYRASARAPGESS